MIARHPRLRRYIRGARVRASAALDKRRRTRKQLERELARCKQHLAEAQHERQRLVSLDYPRADVKILHSVRKRAKAYTKEPFTVEWIERSLKPGETFYDIGANIGAYSLIAAAVSDPSARIFAFEPGYATYGALCENIVVNDQGDRIVPLPISLGQETVLGRFRYRSLAPGAAQHASHGLAVAFDDVPYEQPMLVFALDDLIRMFDLPAPTHIKLDVDGAEAQVIEGARELLSGSAVDTVMLEVAPDDDSAVGLLEGFGFELRERYDRPRPGRSWYALLARG